MHLLTYFSRCFSSLGVLLLDESSDVHVFFFEISSVYFAAAVSPTSSPSSPSSPSFLPSVMLLLTCNTIEPASSPGCGSRAPRCSSALRSGSSSSDLHPRCDLLPSLLCFDRNVHHLALLESPRPHSTWYQWMCFPILLFPLDFFFFSSMPSSVSCSQFAPAAAAFSFLCFHFFTFCLRCGIFCGGGLLIVFR